MKNEEANNEPTNERKAKELMRECDDGAWRIDYSTYKDILVDMGYIDHDQDYALDQYALMHYVGLRHLSVRTTSPRDLARELSVMEEEIPTLRDGYDYVIQHLHVRDKKTVDMAMSEISVGEDLLVIRGGLTKLAGEFDRAATNLVKVIRDFNDERNRLQEKQDSVTQNLETTIPAS